MTVALHRRSALNLGCYVASPMSVVLKLFVLMSPSPLYNYCNDNVGIMNVHISWWPTLNEWWKDLESGKTCFVINWKNQHNLCSSMEIHLIYSKHFQSRPCTP